MRSWTVIGATVATGAVIAFSTPQTPDVRFVDEKILREYAGAYRWEPNAFVYLQMWSEFTGKNQLVAFDESGEVRTLYPPMMTASSPAMAPRFRRRSSPESSFNETVTARLRR